MYPANICASFQAPAIGITPDGKVVECNEAACALLGINPSDIPERYLWDFFSEPSRSKLRLAAGRLAGIESTTGNAEVTDHRGVTHQLHYQIAALQADGGRLAGFLLLAHNVEQNPAQNGTKSESYASSAFHAYLPVLEENVRALILGSMARGLAHQFNNIMAGIISPLEMSLAEPDLPAWLKGSLASARNSVGMGAELSARLLAFCRLGDEPSVPVKCDRLIEDTIYLLQRSFDRRIGFHVNRPSDGVWTAQANVGKVMQSLILLCLNAREGMGQGGSLNFSLENHTRITPLHSDCFVKIEMADTAPVYSRSQEICEGDVKSYQGFPSGTREINLMLAVNYIRQQSGWIEWMERSEVAGNLYNIYLPRSTKASAVTSMSSGYPLGDLRKTQTSEKVSHTVLVVDDEDPIRMVIKAILEYRGFKVIEATDGVTAVRIYQENCASVDIVLLDINLPGCDGWTALCRMRAVNESVKVLMLSGDASNEPPEGPEKANVVGFVTKPFTSDSLGAAIQQALHIKF